MKALLKYMMLALAVMAFAGCERDHLYYGSQELASIYLDIDWSKARMNPNGASVYAYKPNGELYRRFDPFSNPNGGYILLPEGTYNLIVFNNTPDEYEGRLSFKDEYDWNKFQVVSEIDSRATRNHAEVKSAALSRAITSKAEKAAISRADETFTEEPDTFAVGQVLNLVVTNEMTNRYYYDIESIKEYDNPSIVKVVPERVLSTFHINVHVKGLRYAKGPVSSYIRGLARGFYLGQFVNGSDPCTHQFYLNNRKFDEGSDKNGTISADFNTFGLIQGTRADGSPAYYLDMDFVLISGEEYPISLDVTDDIKLNLDTEISVEMNLQLSLELDIDIELPEAIGGDDENPEEGGFKTNVGEWENEEIEVPM